MKRNLLFTLLCAVMLSLPGNMRGAEEETSTSTLSVANDVSLRSDKPTTANAADATLELYTTRTDEQITKDFVGLMSFDIPYKQGYSVKSATLRLVTERAKGTMNIYALGVEITDNDTYNSQSEAITAARSKDPIATQKLKGTSNKAITDKDASSTLSDWVNEIDLTDYVKSMGGHGKCNLLFTNAANSTTTSIKVFTSDAKDVTNSNTNTTFQADDLKPQLVIVYEQVSDINNYTILPTADTFVRSDKSSGNNATSTSLEIMTTATTADTQKDFVGLLSFQLPEDLQYSNYEVQNATLRLVTNSYKGSNSMNLYKYVSDFDETTTYETEKENITSTRNTSAVATFKAAGEKGKSIEKDAVSDSYKTIDKWTNSIELTSCVKGMNGTLNLMLESADKDGQSTKFFSKEITDVTNDKSSLTLSADDLKPQLVVAYALASYELSVTDAGAATLVLPYEATIPEGVKAYTLTYTSGSKAVATEVTGQIPANTPVLINAEEGKYTFAATTTTTTKSETPSSGALTGVWEETTVSQGAYVLQNQNGQVAFYKVNTNDIKLNANQAYLTATAASEGRSSIGISFDGTTGISEIVTEQNTNDGACYTLSGVKVSKDALQKNQVYISNGKAFIAR